MWNYFILGAVLICAFGLLVWREFKMRAVPEEGRLLSVLLAVIVVLGMIAWLILLGLDLNLLAQMLEAFL